MSGTGAPDERRMGAGGIAGRLAAIVYGLCLLAIGGVLAVGGGRLIALGGSPYYLIAGLAAAVSGLAVILGRWRLGATLFLLLMAGTLVWALAEAGLNGWALAPRVLSPAVLGLPFLIGALFSSRGPSRLAGWLCVAAGVVLVAAVAFDSGYRPVQARAAPTAVAAATPQDGDWPIFSRTLDGAYFSPLTQINKANVGKLKVVWTTTLGPALPPRIYGWMQAIPLKVGDSVYVCGPLNDITALDSQNGKVRWRFEPQIDRTGFSQSKCRGVGYYRVPAATGPCAERVYTTTQTGQLFGVDVRTGALCPTFGAGGMVDLREGIKMRGPGYYGLTSAPTIVRGKIVVGGQVADGQYVGEPSGVVRAYDAVTGKLAWAWDAGNPTNHGAPKPGEFYTSGTPNVWGHMSADDALGLVYAPTGVATPDYWGGARTPETNRYGNSVVALDVETGEPRWSFQLTHYDLWDFDVSAQPTLVDLPTKSGVIPVVVQTSKRGQVFVLDRRDGKPVFPVEERPAPQAGAVEHISATQPWSPAMPNLGGPKLKESSMWGLTAIDQLWCRIKFKEARYEGTLTPPGLTPSIADPGYIGGVNWASASVDPARHLAFYASNRTVNYNRLLTRAEALKRGIKVNVTGNHGLAVAQEGAPYAADITPFLSPIKVPCQAPPHGLINAVDLTTGKLLWSRPVGSARDLGPMGMKSGLPFTIGTPTFGGPMTTAGGITFIGATRDHAFRAFDSETGRLLFEGDLPDANSSKPMTYLDAGGRQIVAVTSNASKGGRSYAVITAFALP